MADGKRYYWIKLHKDFFKRHEIRIIEDMPNGKDYILFYLKLLVESVSHEGNLRFSDTIPYNEQMLSTITNTNVDVVRSAIKAFAELEMLEVLNDGTIYMNDVKNMIGSETDWADKKRNQRLPKTEESGHCPQSVPEVSPQCPIRDKSIDTRDIENRDVDVVESKNPTIEEVRAFCKERESIVDADRFFYYYDARNWSDKYEHKLKDWKATFVSWETIEKQRAESKRKEEDKSKRESCGETLSIRDGFDFEQRNTDLDAILRGMA